MDFEAFTDFTTGSLRLMVWYARELVDHREPGVSVHEALDKRVDILRKTTLYDGRHPAMGLDPPNAEWEKLKGHLASILGSRSEDEDTSALEDSCLTLIWPLVKPKLKDAYARSREFTAGPFGCWRFADKDEPDPAIDRDLQRVGVIKRHGGSLGPVHGQAWCLSPEERRNPQTHWKSPVRLWPVPLLHARGTGAPGPTGRRRPVVGLKQRRHSHW